MKSDSIVYARAQAAILRSSGHSVKEIAKFFNKTERWVNKWSKRECFEDKSREFTRSTSQVRSGFGDRDARIQVRGWWTWGREMWDAGI